MAYTYENILCKLPRWLSVFHEGKERLGSSVANGLELVTNSARESQNKMTQP